MTSTIKVNTIQNTCGADIIKESSNTITIGASGDTVTLASGASQTGFGRTGTVDWQTTKKTGDFTATNGEGYFVDTSSGGVTMTMPSGSAGAIVSIQDYNKTFDDNNFTVAPASGEIINGGNAGDSLVIKTEGQGLTFVYVDSTVGWKTVHENEFTAGGANYIVATGGTITTSGDCKIHTFTGPGTFTVSTAAVCAANNVVSYMVVAGGGGGGGSVGNSANAGGGAGGFREDKSPVTPYTASPLDGAGAITVSAQGYPITVGSGGTAGGSPASQPAPGGNGSPSTFSTTTSTGGGGGAGVGGSPVAGNNGGSGGGSVYGASAGSGNTPPVSPSQGNNGGTGSSNPPSWGGGGGGGAGGVGGNASNPAAGVGGIGIGTAIAPASGTPGPSGSLKYFSGGGAGGNCNSATRQPGGYGGGADGGAYPLTSPVSLLNGTANTGGGAAGSAQSTAGVGGSGIVVIRYKFQ